MRSRRKSNGSVLSVATAIPRFCSARQFGYEGPKIAPLILYVESGKDHASQRSAVRDEAKLGFAIRAALAVLGKSGREAEKGREMKSATPSRPTTKIVSRLSEDLSRRIDAWISRATRAAAGSLRGDPSLALRGAR